MAEIKTDKCIKKGIELGGKLRNKRWEQVAAVLLVSVPKIKVKICYRGRSAVAQGNDVLNDRGADIRRLATQDLQFLIVTNQSMLFPERLQDGSSAAVKLESSGRHTFSVNPQQRSSRFPFLEDTSFEKPFRISLMVSATGDVVVNRRIWRREPFVKLLSQLVPCENR